jgi:hypothetical protein
MLAFLEELLWEDCGFLQARFFLERLLQLQGFIRRDHPEVAA